ncbi:MULTISPECIES: hypothetical protein [Arthrobacter]|uniref:Uncharacterized protein n=1 Tax=Arthrobacter psychrochitiniphilus TaxID=291045 RepID=A0A2V3DQ14_9MICC|nr:hypothetical protein [Arthrobacter psychrochitiniphilus]NYG17886.1 hypothetical protein [Arthrobacter psychrochitiniphilus]PXA65092.1 hypothetical protein CVS29_10355 [Arthrobacter psychrochitiniphilus]
MNTAQTQNKTAPEDDDLGQASVRELIVQLALAEDEHRNTANPTKIAALTRREQAIIGALQRGGLGTTTLASPHKLGPSTGFSSENLVGK